MAVLLKGQELVRTESPAGTKEGVARFSYQFSQMWGELKLKNCQ